jgi:polysaccharide export outer membrane protein
MVASVLALSITAGMARIELVQAQAPRTPAPAPTQAALEEYRVGPEDVLEIAVWKNPELTRTVAVRGDGRISLPLINDIQAAGLTPMDLRDIVSKGYSKFDETAEVSVIVKEIHSFKVSVLGMVRLPGRFDLHSQTTVLEALAMAGGLTEFAKKDRIQVIRSDGRSRKNLLFDYSSVLDYGSEQNFVLRPGDIIVVP